MSDKSRSHLLSTCRFYGLTKGVSKHNKCTCDKLNNFSIRCHCCRIEMMSM